MTEFESECCRIPTIFCKSEFKRIFRLTRFWIQLSFCKAQVDHSSQSAVSHTKVNKYTLNSYLLMSVQMKHRIGLELLVQFIVYCIRTK